MSKKSMRYMTIAILVGGASALGGCAGTPASENRTLYSVHQPVVERSQYVIDLNQSSGGLASGEATRLDQWMQVLEVGYGDAIAVDAGGGVVSSGVRRDIADIAAQRGMQIADYAPITDQPFYPGTVRVVVSRSEAYVPGCPDWSKNSQANFNSTTSANYGCATNSNLAAMVANPEDLIRGQKADPSTRSGVDAVKQYREAGPRYGEGDLASGVSGGGSSGAGGGQ